MMSFTKFSLFSKYGGPVQFIDACKETVEFQVVIYYSNNLSANLEKFCLQKCNIWDGNCQLDIQFYEIENNQSGIEVANVEFGDPQAKCKEKAESDGMVVEMKEGDNSNLMKKNNHVTIEDELEIDVRVSMETNTKVTIEEDQIPLETKSAKNDQLLLQLSGFKPY